MSTSRSNTLNCLFNYHVDLKIKVNVSICMPRGYMESGDRASHLHTSQL